MSLRAVPPGQPALAPGLGLLEAGDQGAAPQVPAVPGPARPGRTRGGKRPEPETCTAVALTVRVERDEAAAIDRWIIDLRDDTHRTQLDKSEVIRELLALARAHEPTRRALLKRL
ncbi:hypothetical protein [Kitasatospora sp. NPDC059327]|uniref:hypothetical protein n=1 Tax=Kitasatospora sp. NPDC059327 TaxID=3346803 RepID=UPI0036C58A92